MYLKQKVILDKQEEQIWKLHASSDHKTVIVLHCYAKAAWMPEDQLLVSVYEDFPQEIIDSCFYV